MKKMRLLSLLALALTLLMLLASCGGTGAGTVEVKSLLDKQATVKNPTLSDAVRLPDLAGASLEEKAGDLYYFTAPADTGMKHIVYNAATDTVLLTKTNYYNEQFSVKLLAGRDGRTAEDYPAAYVLSTVYIVNDEPSHATLLLYSEDGTEVARRRYEKEQTAALPTPYERALDLVLFDGVLYRAEGSRLEKVTDVSPFAALPELSSLDCRIGDYYYQLDKTEGTMKAYDSELSPVSVYRVPEYGEVTVFSLLGNGNLLVQYRYEADPFSEEYDVLDGGKLFLVTEIVTAKGGKAKEIRCDYLLGDVFLFGEQQHDLMGVKREKVVMMAEATRIENRRLGERVTLLIDGKGTLSEVSDFNGERFEMLTLADDGAWVLSTEDSRYLIDERGRILGNLDDGSPLGTYINCDGALYRYDLTLLYDYGAEGMEVRSAITREAVILRKAAETGTGYDYYLFTGSGETLRKLVDADDRRKSFYGVVDGCYILRDTGGNTTTYRYYRPDGTEMLALSGTLSVLAGGEEYLLYSAESGSGTTEFYRVAVTD